MNLDIDSPTSPSLCANLGNRGKYILSNYLIKGVDSVINAISAGLSFPYVSTNHSGWLKRMHPQDFSTRRPNLLWKGGLLLGLTAGVTKLSVDYLVEKIFNKIFNKETHAFSPQQKVFYCLTKCITNIALGALSVGIIQVKFQNQFISYLGFNNSTRTISFQAIRLSLTEGIECLRQLNQIGFKSIVGKELKDCSLPTQVLVNGLQATGEVLGGTLLAIGAAHLLLPMHAYHISRIQADQLLFFQVASASVGLSKIAHLCQIHFSKLNTHFSRIF